MKNYYLLNNGRLRRTDHSLVVESADGQKKPIPIEDVDSLYVYGEVDLNSKAFSTFLSPPRKSRCTSSTTTGFTAAATIPASFSISGHLLVHQVSPLQRPGPAP